jgi:hypothetical protein
MRALIIVSVLLVASTASGQTTVPAPAPWRDPETGCTYLVSPQGGIAIRYAQNGLPDCPGASLALGEQEIGTTIRALSRAIDDLSRDIEGLRREIQGSK